MIRKRDIYLKTWGNWFLIMCPYQTWFCPPHLVNCVFTDSWQRGEEGSSDKSAGWRELGHDLNSNLEKTVKFQASISELIVWSWLCLYLKKYCSCKFFFFFSFFSVFWWSSDVCTLCCSCTVILPWEECWLTHYECFGSCLSGEASVNADDPSSGTVYWKIHSDTSLYIHIHILPGYTLSKHTYHPRSKAGTKLFCSVLF